MYLGWLISIGEELRPSFGVLDHCCGWYYFLSPLATDCIIEIHSTIPVIKILNIKSMFVISISGMPCNFISFEITTSWDILSPTWTVACNCCRCNKLFSIVWANRTVEFLSRLVVSKVFLLDCVNVVLKTNMPSYNEASGASRDFRTSFHLNKSVSLLFRSLTWNANKN